MSTTKYKRVKRDGKVYLISSKDKGKTWSKPKLYNSKEHKETLKKEREQNKESIKITRKNPFHRKHGDDAEKKRIDSLAHLSDRQKRIKKRNIDAGKSTTKSKSKATMTGKERAQAMAKRNIKKHGGTASAAAANKEAMRQKIKERYQAKQNQKKKEKDSKTLKKANKNWWTTM